MLLTAGRKKSSSEGRKKGGHDGFEREEGKGDRGKEVGSKCCNCQRVAVVIIVDVLCAKW